MIERPRFAFLFEGQGNQVPGMWSDLYKRGGEASRIFNKADLLCLREGLPFKITDACFRTEGNILVGEGYDPIALQLSILTGETATVAYLHENGVLRAAANAGHSLGQLPAGVESGFWTFDTAFKFTVARSRAMDRVSQTRKLVVCVVSDLREEAGNLVGDAQKILKDLGDDAKGTKITVLNHARQLLTTGPLQEVERFKERFEKDHKGIRVRQMPKVPFSHHPDMAEAQKEINQVLRSLRGEFDRRVNVAHLADVKDEVIRGAKSFRGALGMQLVSAVLWSANWRRLKNLGIELAVEIGPGDIFPNMAKIDFPHLEVLLTKDLTAIDMVVERLAMPTTTYSIPNSSVE